jgi:hypothetical protein
VSAPLILSQSSMNDSSSKRKASDSTDLESSQPSASSHTIKEPSCKKAKQGNEASSEIAAPDADIHEAVSSASDQADSIDKALIHNNILKVAQASAEAGFWLGYRISSASSMYHTMQRDDLTAKLLESYRTMKDPCIFMDGPTWYEKYRQPVADEVERLRIQLLKSGDSKDPSSDAVAGTIDKTE